MWHDISAIEGPERIAPEWWKHEEAALTRDYFRAECFGPEVLAVSRRDSTRLKQFSRAGSCTAFARDPCPYAELQVTTNYSFLRSGSHPGELVFQAANSALRDRHRRPQHAGRRRARLFGGEGILRRDRHPARQPDQAAGRRPAGDARRLFAARLSDDRRGLQAAVAAAEQRQSCTRRRANAISPSTISRRIRRHIAGHRPAAAEHRGSRLHDKLRRLAGLYRGRCYLAATMLFRGDDATRVAYLDNLATQTKRAARRHQRRALSRPRAPGAARRASPASANMHARGAGLRCSKPMPSGI